MSYYPTRAALLALAFLVPAGYEPGVQVGRLESGALTEASGLASSGRSGEVLFTHNDSGAAPVIYAINRKGELLATIPVKNAAALDWEDIARGPGPDGKPALYLGDIGDNLVFRPVVSVYRIPEPVVDPKKRGVTIESAPAARIDLKYPDGPHNAETLLVDPKSGRMYLVTKSPEGSEVFAAPEHPKVGAINPLEKIGAIRFQDFPKSAGAARDPAGSLLATGGAISPQGDRVVVRTYTDAHEWPIGAGGLAGAFRQEPLHIPLPPVKHGEAITYSADGRSLLVTEEGEHAPIFELKPK